MKKNLLFTLSARWIALFGSYLQIAILPIILFNITHSASLLAKTYLAETLPWIFVSPFLIPFLNKYANDKLVICINPIIRGVLVVLLAIFIYNHYTVVVIFFILGIMNAINASYNMKLMKSVIPEDRLDSYLGIILALDDVISVIAPLIVTFLLAKDVQPMIIIIINAFALTLNSLILFQVEMKWVHKNEINENKKVGISRESILWLFKNSKMRLLTTIEMLRSIAEGIFIPLLIVYFNVMIGGKDETFSFAGTLMCLAQVVFSFMYTIMSNRFHKKRLIMFATLSICFSLFIFINTKSVIFFLMASVLLGAGMSIRQLVAENMLISIPSEKDIAMATTNYNATIASAYLIGYFISVTQTKNNVIIYFKVALLITIFSLIIAMRYNEVIVIEPE
ncbi:MFS transporter [Lactobacillus acetotolerans]|uniref:MFS transporter n=1 Tax=Lactobacillus acetotolerans TaxID=1600 RepID=UPI00241CA50B|nr:MFS transporter [Lactobacillus acetotolerans]